MALEAPSTGAAALTPSPSNFSALMEQRNAANDQGLDQPLTNGFGEAPSRQPKRSARDEDPARVEKTLDGSQAGDPDTELGEEPIELEQEQEQDEQLDPQEKAKQEFLSKLAEALEQGQLPVDQLGEMLVKVQLPGGRETEVTLKELQRGFLRTADYTRKLHEATQMRDQGQHIINLERQRRQEWQNEDTMIRDIASMGLADAFDRAVVRYARQQVEFRQLPPHEQQRITLTRQMEQQKAAFEAERRELLKHLQQREPANQQAEVTRHFQNQLAQMVPAAFKQFGLGTYPAAKEAFMRNLQTLYEGGPCTRQLVDDACQAAKDELDDMAARMGTAPARPRGGPLPPRRVSGAAGPGVQSFTGNGKRSRPSAFGTRFSSSGI